MRKRSYRSFAAPFVIVLAGCGGKPVPTTGPTIAGESATLPDPPAGEATRTQSPDGLTVFEYASGHRVTIGVDGKCRAEYKEDCGGGGGGSDEPPDVIDCNPPPPQEVKCPK